MQVLLRPGLDQIARTQAFDFDFDLERRVLSEDAGGGSVGAAPQQPVDDPFQLVLERYMQMGYEARLAVLPQCSHAIDACNSSTLRGRQDSGALSKVLRINPLTALFFAAAGGGGDGIGGARWPGGAGSGVHRPVCIIAL